MGASNDMQTIKDKMVMLGMERIEIQMKKAKAMEKLAELEGHQIEKSVVPDFIDPSFAKEKNITAEYIIFKHVEGDDDDNKNKEKNEKKLENEPTRDDNHHEDKNKTSKDNKEKSKKSKSKHKEDKKKKKKEEEEE